MSDSSEPDPTPVSGMFSVRADRVPADPLVRAGLLVFAIGVAVIVFAVIGFFLGVHNWPLWLNVCCGAFAPAGFLIAIVGALRSGRRDQQDALRAVQGR